MNLEKTLEKSQELFDIHLITIGGTKVTAWTVVVFVAILLFTLMLSWFLRRAVTRFLRLRKVEDRGTIAVTRRLLHYVVIAIGFGVALHTIGVNLTGLFAAGAIFAVGIGFAMQNIAENFVSGVILLVERSITPGDVLHVDGKLVRVEELGIRATRVRTRDDEDLIVPNANLIQSTVTNHTLEDSLYRIRASVGVAYDTDVEHAMKLLLDAAKAIEGRSMRRDPAALLLEFADSAVALEVSVWVEAPWESAVGKSDLNLTIWRTLRDANITIAFPQLDVHLAPEVEQGLSRSSSPAA